MPEPIAILDGEPADQQTDAWWSRPFSVFQTNLQEIDATLDVESVLDTITDYGADTWLLNTGGIFSFYPSELDFQTPSSFLTRRPSGDLIGDAVTEARARGVRVLSRLDLSKVAAPIARQHPEWLFVSPTGAPQVYNGLYSTCPSADYYQYRTIDIVDEIIDRYPVDGFFFNWFGFSERDYSRVYHGPCHCEACAVGFAEFANGIPLPTGPEDASYATWLHFTEDVIRRLTTRIANHIRDRRPDAALVLGDGAQMIYVEANNAFGREYWPHATAEVVSARVSSAPQTRVVVNSVSFSDMPYRMSGEQPESFAQYLLQAISRGAMPSTYIMGAPGRIPYANLAIGRSITAFHRANYELYGALAPAARIGLVLPGSARGLRHLDPEHVTEFRGMYAALQEAHLPFDVLPMTALASIGSAPQLERFDVLVMPDLGPIGTAAAEAVDAWVHSGGQVILTGRSALGDDRVMELTTAPAVIASGGALEDHDLWSSYVAVNPQPDIDDYRYEPSVLPVFGFWQRFIWRPAAMRAGEFLPQAPFGPPEKCWGHRASGDPGSVRMDSGLGSVTMVPWTVGATYREFGTTEIRDYISEIVGKLVDPEISVSLPDSVDVSVGRAGDAIVVHLINQSGVRRRSVGAHLPIEGGRMRVRGGATARRVECLAAGVEAPFTRDGDDILIDLPRLELFEVVKVS
jgi:hypothetical protein